MAKVLILGHRGMGCSLPGAISRFPENTLTSFKEARKMGADGVELDVFLSKNGEVLVIHGYTAKDSLCLTTMRRVPGSAPKPFTLENLVEQEDIKASDLLIRKPWLMLQGEENIDSIVQKHRSDIPASFEKYINCIEDFNGECVPTLEQVINELGDSIQYNIELKGTRPELGPRVLEILEKHPNLKVIISSFNWTSPELSKDSPNYENIWERTPNGPMNVDLLRPLVGNKLGIPIGLLFNNVESKLPSIERILECAKSFKAEWVNVSHDFWKETQPFVGSDLKGIEALKHLIEEMHKNNIKVLSYFLEATLDTEEDFKNHIEANVDALCPNDVEVAVRVARTLHDAPTH